MGIVRTTCVMIGSVIALAAVGKIVSLDAVAVAPSPESGRETSVRWCASCHEVAIGTQNEQDYYSATSFADVANRMEPVSLRHYLAKPHIGPTPGFTLNEREVEDVAAYIETFRPDQPLVITTELQP